MFTRWGGLRVALLGALLCLGLLAVGCGGGSSSTSSSGSEAEPSAQFLKPKGKNTIAEFGEESTVEEREAAGAIVVKSLEARESGDWAAQCETLDQKGIEEIPGAKSHENCPKLLKVFASPLPSTKEIRKDRLSGSIAAFRVKGDQGYALFHGNNGKNYAIPLEKEAGSWKLSAVNTIEI
jgi:hypothetical protein